MPRRCAICVTPMSGLASIALAASMSSSVSFGDGLPCDQRAVLDFRTPRSAGYGCTRSLQEVVVTLFSGEPQLRTIEGIQIDWNETLWRYCTVERFEWMVGNRRMYFAAADQFVDPFEGAVAVQTNTPPPDPRYAEMELDESAFFELKRLTKLNCWHRAEYESDAMWKLYAGQSKGIAVCSTPDRMRRSFQPFRLHPDYGVEELWAIPSVTSI